MKTTHWLEKLEPARRVAKFMAESSTIVQPGLYGAKILGFGAISGYISLQIANSLFGQKMDGSRVKEEDVFPLFRPFFDALHYNRFDDDPREKWKEVFHRAFVGAGFVAGAYFGARDFFKNYPSQTILSEYKAPDGKNFGGLTMEMIENLIKHGLEDEEKVKSLTGGMSLEKVKNGLGEFFDHHSGFKMDRLSRVTLGNHTGPAGAVSTAMGGGSGAAYTPIRSSVFNGIQYLFGADWQVAMPGLGKFLSNSGNAERGGSFRQLHNAFAVASHNLTMLESPVESDAYKRAVREIQNFVDGALHPQFVRSGEGKSAEYTKFVEEFSGRIIEKALAFKEKYHATLDTPKHQATIDEIYNSMKAEFLNRGFFKHAIEAQRKVGFSKPPKVDLGILGTAANAISKASQSLFGMGGDAEEINTRLDVAWRAAHIFSDISGVQR